MEFFNCTNEQWFLGDANSGISDPQYTLEAGRGYVAGIDLRGSFAGSYTDISQNYPSIIFDQRAKDGYYFNRFQFANDPQRKGNQISKSEKY